MTYSIKKEFQKLETNNSTNSNSSCIEKYTELERFFTAFLTNLSSAEAKVLSKILIKYFTSNRNSMTRILSNLEFILECEKNELKMLTNYDQFKMTIMNWKTLFLLEDLSNIE